MHHKRLHRRAILARSSPPCAHDHARSRYSRPAIEWYDFFLYGTAAGLIFGKSEQAPFYIFTAFIFAYAVGTLHMSWDLILSAVMVAACVSFISIPLSGHISDRIGRRRMYLIGVVVTGLFGFLYFGMVDTAIPWAVFIAIVLSLIPHDIQSSFRAQHDRRLARLVNERQAQTSDTVKKNRSAVSVPLMVGGRAWASGR